MKNVGKSIQTGFTMIEIMVVVAILGILAAMVVPSIIGKDDQARVARAKSDIKAVASALDMYKLDNYKYPTTEQGLEALVNKPESAKSWPEGGYLKKVPNDPWETPFVYISPAEGAPYEVISYGSDGQEGGEGYAADISSKNL